MSLTRLIKLKTLGSFTVRLYSTSSSDQPQKLSYYHHIGKEPLTYRTVGQHLEAAAQQYPDRDAIVSVHESQRFTFRQVLEKADRLAASFHRIGLKRGDFIGIWAPNYAFWYVSMMAAARAGLVSVGINPAFQSNEIEYCINKVQLKAIIAAESFKTTHYYEILKTIIPEVPDSEPGKIVSKRAPSLKSIIINSTAKLPGAFQYEDIFNFPATDEIQKIKDDQHLIQPDSPCNVQFTSGTTGHPKATLISHFGTVNNGIHVAQRNELNTKHERICVQVPLFHAFGITITISAAMSFGSTLVLPAPLYNPQASIEAINKEKCTVIHGTPTMYVDLIKKIQATGATIESLKTAVTGGACCSPELFRNMKQILNVEKVKTVFGLTESTAVACQSLPGETDDHVLHTIGHVTDHVELKVIDREGQTVPFGQPGELCIRGYLNCLGYYGDPEKTRELIGDDRWLRTGDQFILQEDGYGRIVGRLKEMIIRGGENLFPKEIEDFLNTHSSVMETHVIGVPDERMGEELCAFIRLKDGGDVKNLTRDDLKKFATGKIAHFKVPRYVRIVDDFPKTTSGKIQKFKLLEQFLGTSQS